MYADMAEDTEGLIEHISSIDSDIEPSIPMSTQCKSFLNACLKLDPEDRMTATELLDHPFLIMTKDETRESRRASGMMSFFSIVASQTSVSEMKNTRE